jgi:hypothetical protein
VVPEALWLLIAHRRSRTVLTAVGLTAVCGLALIPLALSQNGTGRANWIHHAPPGRRVGQIVPQFVFGFASPAYSVLEPVAIALAAFGVILLLARGGGSVRRGALLAGSIALAGFVINLLLVAAGIDDLLTRNLLALWLPAAVAVTGGFALARWRVVGGAAAGLLCALGVAAAIGVARDRNVQRPDWRGVARVLGPRPLAGAGGRVIFVQHYRDLLPLSLYLPHLRFMRTSAVRVSELDVVSFASPPSSGFCWWGSACNLWPSRPQASYAVPGFRVLWRRHAYQFTVLRMVADRGGALVTPSLVSRALTTTRYANDELLIQR